MRIDNGNMAIRLSRRSVTTPSTTAIDITAGAILLDSGIEERKRGDENTRAILASLSSNIALIAGDGEIIATNPAWDGFAMQNAGVPERCGVGSCRSLSVRITTSIFNTLWRQVKLASLALAEK
jgi:hypothetical protein